MTKKFNLLILIFISFFYDAFSASLSWSEPCPQISDSSSNVANAQIAIDSSGQYVYAVWQPQAYLSNSIKFAKSNDYGSSFSSPQCLVSATLNVKNPQIITNPTGQYIYSVWNKSDGTYYVVQFIKSTNYGSSFSSVINLSTADQNAYFPQLVTDTTGQYITAIWQKFDGINYVVQKTCSTDYGAAFSAPSALSQSGASRPKIVSSSDGSYIYVVWQKSGSNKIVVQFSKSADYGATFSDPVTVSESTSSASFPKIKTSSSGEYLIIIWQKNTNSNYAVQACISTDYGATFSEPIDLSIESYATFPKIKMSSSGQYVYVCWHRYSNSKNVIKFTRSTNYGTSFSTPVNVSLSSHNSTFPHIAIDPTGQYMTLVWQSNVGNYSVVQSASSSDYGANFTSLQTLSDSSCNAYDPKIKMSSSGAASYSLWKIFDGRRFVLKMQKGTQ